MTDSKGRFIGKWRAQQPELGKGQINTTIPAHIKKLESGMFHVTWREVGTLKWEDE